MNMKNTMKIFLTLTLILLLVTVVSADDTANQIVTSDNIQSDNTLTEASPATSLVEDSVTDREYVSKTLIKEDNTPVKTGSNTFEVNDFDTFQNILTDDTYDSVNININSNIIINNSFEVNEAIQTLNINGNGMAISGSIEYDDFMIIKSTTTTITNLNLVNCTSDVYHGIVNYADLTITNCTIKNNGMDSPLICNLGNLSITDSTLTNNTALCGGAIFNRGSLNITNTTLIDNHASNGGAIYNMGNTTILNSTLTNNRANGWETEGYGGAIYNEGNVTIINTTLCDNEGNYGDWITDLGNGGAIYNNGTLNLTNSILNNNKASIGGAIYSINRNLTMTNCTLNNNTARYEGGAIYSNGYLSITGTTLNNNIAEDGVGGAVYNYGNSHITDSTLNNNTAVSYSTDEWINGFGGAIYNVDNITITNTTLNDNKAVSIYPNEYSGGYGAAISNRGKTTMTNCTLNNNNANNNGGAINNQGNITITNTQLNNNSASDHGGAIYNEGTLNITASLLVNNTATKSSAISNNANATIYNNTFRTNKADRYQNAIIDVSQTAEIRDNINDKISIYYGTIYTNGSDVKIIQNLFDDELNYTTITINNIPDTQYTDKIFITGKFAKTTGETISNATIVLMINNASYNTITDTDGNYAISYTATKVGINNITAIFNGNTVYNSTKTYKTFLVTKKDTAITINNIPDTEYLDKVTVTGKFTRNTGEALKNATITLMINNVNYSAKTDSNGNYALNYTVTKIGENNVTAIFAGNSVYNNVNTTKNFVVNKKDTIITLNYIPDTEYSDKITISGKFTRNTGEPLTNATITLTVNGIKYTAKTDAKGKYALNYTVAKIGTNNVTAAFTGNSVYNSADTSKTFMVSKKDTILTLNYIPDTEYSDKITISGKFTRNTGEPLTNATITLTVNGVKYTTKTNTNGKYAINYTTTKIGTNNVKASFAENSVYNSANTSKTFMVSKKDTILTLNYIPDTEYSDKITISGKFTRNTGEPLTNATITLTVNGVKYTTKTNTKGIYAINYTVTKVGTNNVKASFAGNSVYNSANASKTFTVDKKYTKITLNDITGTQYSNRITITGKLTRSSGEALKNATIVLMINNVKYTTKTDANGVYALNYTATKVGTNNITATFNANSVYNGVTTFKTFTVDKKDTKISINNIPSTKLSNKVTISGKFTRKTGEAITNATISLKINGANYTTKTDTNGNFKLNYTTTKVGTNNVTATFNGNSVYNSVNATMTFTVTR